MSTNSELIKLQQHSFQILQKFDALCSKNGIEYSLAYGTMLGAIRHNGYIPWDDDVDIVITRSNYDRFLEVCGDIGEGYFIQNHLTDKNTFHNFTRICMDHTVMLQTIYKELDNHKGIFIDIFPLDSMPESSELREKQFKSLMFLRYLKTVKMKQHNEGLLKSIVRKGVQTLLLPITFKTINKRAEKIAKKYNEQEGTTKVVGMSDISPTNYYDFTYNKTDMEHLIRVDFNGKPFLVCSNYDLILKAQYGNYMEWPSKDKQVPHHGVEEIVFRKDVGQEI